MTHPIYIGGKTASPEAKIDVTDKYSGKVFAQVGLASRKDILNAIEAAVKASKPLAAMPSFERARILYHCVNRFKERAEEFARVLCQEAGKPIRDSQVEVGRLIDTFQTAAEESTRFRGEVLPLDVTPRAKGYLGFWKRVPIGPCSFISPFNFPLNLVAHKVAPALAVGCPFILKPATKTPIGALMIGEVLSECNLPEGSFSILPCPRDGADLFAEDERLKFLSFTGSPSVGWELKKRSGKKKVTLELGGNAACIVDEDANLDDAVKRIVIGAFSQAGQSCISVQRILVHTSVYSAFKEKLVAATRLLKSGDPSKEETAVGPLISESEAVRLEKWIGSAVGHGGKILVGGKRMGAVLEPTLLENVPPDEDLCAEEAFGPVAVLSPFSSFEDALKEVNKGRFGLQAGIFTRDLYKAHRAWDELEVGGVIIGDIPSWRVDHMPYGGVKDSGLGREGVRFAMEDMSEIRLMAVRTPS